MIHQQKMTIPRQLQPSSSKLQTQMTLYKATFRLRQIRASNLSPLKQPSSPKNTTDYYSMQQATQQRIRLRNQQMSNTAAGFFSKRSTISRQGSADEKNNMMHRTFYRPTSKDSNQNSQAMFNKTTANFRKTSVNNIYKNQNNDNYLNKYQIIKELGKGSFSVVFLAKKRDQMAKSIVASEKIQQNPQIDRELQDEQEIQGDLVAIKVYEKFKTNKDPHKFKNIRKEINIMQNLQNQGVVKLLESVQTLTKISLVVEYGGDQSLLQFVKKNFPLKLAQVRDIAIQLIKAIEYLHSKNIVHRDIKLQNVLMRDGKVKLIDFGFSCLTHKQQKLTVICGTPNYMAPQVISRKEYIGEQADIWSYGVVVYALAEGRHPFKAQTYNELERLVNKGKVQFKNTSDLKFISFIRSILRVKPIERPSASQILEMNWLKGQQNL